ncbi:MAG: HlyD family secretion protein [Azospirillaceae bacterium]|nr:HlyD family secretion protein [Azospirillaceae bacterium]
MADGGDIASTSEDGSAAAPDFVMPVRRRRVRLRTLIRPLLLIAGPLAVLIGVGWFWVTGGRIVAIDDAYVRADKVALSTDVSGIVSAVLVQDNQPVKEGQVLFTLDDEPFRLTLQRADAQLGSIRNQIQSAKANYRQKLSELQLARTNIDYSQHEFQRQQNLLQQHVASQQEYDKAKNTFDLARQQVPVIEQQIAALVAALDGNPDLPVEAYVSYKQAQAQRDQAARDLRHTTVRAPMDGIVTNVPALRPGAYLPAATPAFALVADSSAWIEAQPKETELTFVKPGDPVTVTVDTYPDAQWHGHVASLSPASGSEFSLLPAQNSSGNWVKVVQRIPIRIAIDKRPDQPSLRAGMSAVVEIDTDHHRTLPWGIGVALGMEAH